MVRVDLAQLRPGGVELMLEFSVLALDLTRSRVEGGGFLSEAVVLVLYLLVTPLQAPDVLDRLGEDFPLARLVSWGIGKDAVKFVEQLLHLTSPLPLGHLVADAQLGGPAVVASARRC